MANGFGSFTDAKGLRYSGFWKNDEMHGNGVEYWDTGAKYEG